jgi:dolichol-phosphate mannosyltransferase
LELEARGFEIEAEMFAECVRNGLRIAEIPITYRARADQPKLSSLRDGVKIGMFLWKRRLGQVSENVGQTHLETNKH